MCKRWLLCFSLVAATMECPLPRQRAMIDCIWSLIRHYYKCLSDWLVDWVGSCLVGWPASWLVAWVVGCLLVWTNDITVFNRHLHDRLLSMTSRSSVTNTKRCSAVVPLPRDARTWWHGVLKHTFDTCQIPFLGHSTLATEAVTMTTILRSHVVMLPRRRKQRHETRK